ncbi:MAG: Tat pathway signal protein [Bacteroidetes bacterium HGW-Bacteroidetes-1]|nr:MAG: Tat pathway signal protein [Bacteroidetes bacterium HGW-Bacteroidetes-1]
MILTFFFAGTIFVSCQGNTSGNKTVPDNSTVPVISKEAFLEDLKLRTFKYFWEVVDTANYQTDDRYPTKDFTSIAATGFAFSAYIIGVENKYITRAEGAERVRKALLWLWNSRQGVEVSGDTGNRGFYYHFLNYGDGTRYKDVELSTIDTGLLFAGILACQSYFDGDTEDETQIRQLADSLFLRVEWDWAMNGNPTMSMGWRPESGFISSTWNGYNEAMVLLIMAMASPSHPIPADSWKNWCSTYEWEDFYGYEHVNFGPLFGHQYSHLFIDFRGIQDDYMKHRGIDYFENSRRATLSNRTYCIDNPNQFVGYNENVWGLTASDGPANEIRVWKENDVHFKTYNARGAAKGYLNDDGTIAPTAAGGSIPFAPDECIESLYAMRNLFGDKLYQEYGFKDAFNLTYSEEGWFNKDYIGIDQGPILIMIENYQTGLIWNLMKKNSYIRAGLQKAGFEGGWLDEKE